MRAIFSLILLAPLLAHTELLDQIAIVVEKSIIKESDIKRDIRLMQFLNNEPLRIDHEERRKAAGKLIDQILLREEIQTAGYPEATDQEVNSQIAALENTRFHSESALQMSLAKYSLDEAELREQLRWQLTVLQFIDLRFKAAAITQDAAVEEYYRDHVSALKKSSPRASVDDLHLQAREILVGEEVNRLLDSWLEERRKKVKISFLEDGLV
jgi:hypothetical protein